MKNRMIQALVAAQIQAYAGDQLPETCAYPCAIVWDTGVRAIDKTTGQREFEILAQAESNRQVMALVSKIREALRSIPVLREVENDQEACPDITASPLRYKLRFRMLCGR